MKLSNQNICNLQGFKNFWGKYQMPLGGGGHFWGGGSFLGGEHSPPQDYNHGGRKRHEIRQGSTNFLSLVLNITKLPHRMELDIPKNRMFFVFRYCYILAGK